MDLIPFLLGNPMVRPQWLPGELTRVLKAGVGSGVCSKVFLQESGLNLK